MKDLFINPPLPNATGGKIVIGGMDFDYVMVDECTIQLHAPAPTPCPIEVHADCPIIQTEAQAPPPWTI